MRIDLEIPSVRVYQTDTYKGHPVAVAEILGVPVMYADGTLESHEAGMWEDILKTRLARVLCRLMLAEGHEGDPWAEDTRTGREVNHYDTVRYEMERD